MWSSSIHFNRSLSTKTFYTTGRRTRKRSISMEDVKDDSCKSTPKADVRSIPTYQLPSPIVDVSENLSVFECSNEDDVKTDQTINNTLSHVITLNVCGRRFQVSRGCLEKFPQTLLGNPRTLRKFYNPTTREYFIEENPQYFPIILSFYLSGSLHYPRNQCPIAFLNYIKTFGLESDLIGECCQDDFEDAYSYCLERENSQKNLDIREVNLETEQMVEEILVGRCTTQVQICLLKKHILQEEGCLGWNNPEDSVSMTKFQLWRQQLWRAFENPNNSYLSVVVYYVTAFFIALSVLANIIETLECEVVNERIISYGECYSSIFSCVDTCCVVIFTLEYLARLMAAPDRLQFVKSKMSLIDILAIMPFYFGLLISDNKNVSGAFVTLRVFRVVRIFKLSRHSQGLRVLGYTLRACASELGFLLFSLTMAIIIFGTIMYYMEKISAKSQFTSIPTSFWYTIVTMTTLGYGDIVPTTVFGRIVGSICSLCGVLVIALPVPFIVSNFSRIYQHSQKLEKKQAKRNRYLRIKIEKLIQLLNANGGVTEKEELSTNLESLLSRKHSRLSTKY